MEEVHRERQVGNPLSEVTDIAGSILVVLRIPLSLFWLLASNRFLGSSFLPLKRSILPSFPTRLIAETRSALLCRSVIPHNFRNFN